MEANRDDSRRCIKIAEKWIKSGNIEKGEKFLKKSIHLYPNERANDLLQQLQINKNKSKRTSSQNNGFNAGQRFSASGSLIEYTREQLENVQR
ncbi:dnaJ homolog subfamily B member 14-like [Homalodisca vitripennis]|uniref:dnaJ homolog subfamily B member 14-like n=1 Tax=Homalodisca vitripennis TaxID=197043 RepID=UPI001EEC869A|nr:dnaJ homolog subfamily B member 14-like [Homalodisca vitripennis]